MGHHRATSARSRNLHTLLLLAAAGCGRFGFEVPTAADSAPGYDLATVVADVGAGTAHTCVLTAIGSVLCGGDNSSRQLGSSTPASSTAALPVPGLDSSVVQLAVGDDHACALMSTGGLLCWGSDGEGRLGDGSASGGGAPVVPVGLDAGVKEVAAGGSHTCAVTHAGAVKCWGHNNYGQLGDNSHEDRDQPVDVVGLSSGAQAVSCGGCGIHSCALMETGAVKCWGSAYAGGLGDGQSSTDRLTPVDVVGLPEAAVQISAAEDGTCAIGISGRLYCWGRNDWGELGTGDTNDVNSAVEVSGLPGPVRQVETGHFHVCAVLESGQVRCWGQGAHGAIGDGQSNGNDVWLPAAVATVETFARVNAGRRHTCAVGEDGSLWCWGDGNSGQLLIDVPRAWLPVKVMSPVLAAP